MTESVTENFKDIELKDRTILQAYFATADFQCCEFNFANLFNWRDSYRIRWKIHNEYLLIHNLTDDIIFMPVSSQYPPVSYLSALSEKFIDAGFSGLIGGVTEDFFKQNSAEIGKYFSAEILEDELEYIYSVEKLVRLQGEKLHKKKNLISQFIRNNPDYKVSRLTKNMLEQCIEFNRRWADEKNDLEALHLKEEELALSSAFENFDSLGMEGLAIFISDRMVAYSIFAKLNKDTYDEYFEKAERAVKGAAQMINWETMKELAPKCKYVNREQDLGEKGLKQAKLSYMPEYLLPLYYLHPLKPQ